MKNDNENYIDKAYPDFKMQILTATMALIFDISYFTLNLVYSICVWIYNSDAVYHRKRTCWFYPCIIRSAFYGVTFGVVYVNSHPMPLDWLKQ